MHAVVNNQIETVKFLGMMLCLYVVVFMCCCVSAIVLKWSFAVLLCCEVAVVLCVLHSDYVCCDYYGLAAVAFSLLFVV